MRDRDRRLAVLERRARLEPTPAEVELWALPRHLTFSEIKQGQRALERCGTVATRS